MVVKRTPTMIAPKRDSWSAKNGEILPAKNEELEGLMRKEQEQDDAAAAEAAAERHRTDLWCRCLQLGLDASLCLHAGLVLA
jgi:hypothetical protein